MDLIGILKTITYFNNTLYDYAVALGWFFGLLVVLKIFQLVVLKKLEVLSKKTKTRIDDLMIELVGGIRPSVYFLVAFYFAYRALEFPEIVSKVIGFLVFFFVVYEVISLLGKVADYYISIHVDRQKTEGEKKQTRAVLRLMRGLAIIAFWILGVLLILSNYGVNVTSLIASLGIGGIAVALALQNILTDVFSSFSIFVDKPFQIGDFIIVGQDMGTVQKVGIKSTRIKTLQGQELVISNKELTSARVQNYGAMERRRVPVTLGVVYGTPRTKLESIPRLIKKIITGVKDATFDRCHFKTYGPYSLDFELIYYVESGDYNKYMDINQKINLAIYKVFEEEGIEFAYPTQTIIGKLETGK